MALYKVIEYSRNPKYHKVKSLFDGKEYRIDLFVSASFFDGNPVKEGMSIDEYNEALESLVGKNIEIEDMYPYEYIAEGIKVIE